ncbi:mitochondrial thiamine pyrophosphate carrier [Drosophila navojoa]|nr:mitochondrial thiamine pyrophosphate carrier [Drosophila navojoa]
MRREKKASNSNSAKVQMLQALGGGVSGALTRFVAHPFDVLKIRFQLQVEPLKKRSNVSKYAGMLQAFSSIFREEGLRGIWKGHLPAQMMSITYALVQFWSYEQLHTAMLQYKFGRDNVHLSYFMCGGLAGCVGTVVAQPFDVVRTRVVAADPGTTAGTLKPLSGVHKVFKREGLRGVSSGMMMTLVQIYPLVGANFVIYKFLNHFTFKIISLIREEKHVRREIPGALLFMNGAISGVLAKVLVYPADLIKKRTMLSHFQEDRKSFGVNPLCDTIMLCIRSTLEKEGVRGFYKGMWPTLFKSGVMSACYFTIYDYFNNKITVPYKQYERQQNEEKNKAKK